MTSDLELFSVGAQKQADFPAEPTLVEAQPLRIEFVACEATSVARLDHELSPCESNALVVRRVPAVQVESGGERKHFDSGKGQDGPRTETREDQRDTERNAH